MTLYIDDSLMTAHVRMPLAEGWLETDIPFEVRMGLAAVDVGPGDVALIAAPESTLLGRTHVVAPEVAVVAEAISAIAMRTPVRPDGIEETPIRMLDAGSTAEVLIRALLRPFFGITALSFVTSDEDEGSADAQVIVVDGPLGLSEPEAGFHEDLARAWFVLTGQAVVHHVLVVGVEVEARGPAPEIDLLRQAITMGQERRRDVRRMVAEAAEIDRDRLAGLTNRIRYELTAADRQSLRNLLARGTWGSRFQRTLPAFRDEVAG
jgi:predicted solute-binding protein